MDLSVFATPEAWISLITLIFLEIVLGVDNLVFISITTNRLPEEKFDDAMGVSTGAAVIFGATGGVMEAALRTAADLSPARARRPSSTPRSAAPRASRRPSTRWPAWT